MKKIIILVLIMISVISIYYVFKDNKIYYTSIDLDGMLEYSYQNYIVDYLIEKDVYEDYVSISNPKYRIIDLIRDINDNAIYFEKTIKNILIKTDILTIKLGYNDIISKIPFYNSYELYNYINEYLTDLDSVLSLLRSNDKEKIILLGYYNIYGEKYDDIFTYINIKVKNVAQKYEIDFLDIQKLFGYKEKLDLFDNRKIFEKLKNMVDIVIENKS